MALLISTDTAYRNYSSSVFSYHRTKRPPDLLHYLDYDHPFWMMSLRQQRRKPRKLAPHSLLQTRKTRRFASIARRCRRRLPTPRLLSHGGRTGQASGSMGMKSFRSFQRSRKLRVTGERLTGIDTAGNERNRRKKSPGRQSAWEYKEGSSQSPGAFNLRDNALFVFIPIS